MTSPPRERNLTLVKDAPTRARPSAPAGVPTGTNGAPARPRLLLLAQTLPFPPDGGVNIRIYNVLRLLARQYDVTLLCFMRRAERQTPGAVASGIAGLLPYADVAVFPIPQEYNRLRLLWDHVRSVVTGKAYTWFTYESRDFRSRVRSLLAERKFEIVQIDSLDLATYLPDLANHPVVCVHHNVESTLMHRRAQMQPSRWRRAYLHFQARLLTKLEREWCEHVALNVAVSDADRIALHLQAPHGRYATVPNGVDVDEFQPSKAREEGIVSTGGLNWFPNADALRHFTDDILPRIRALRPNTRVRWVGRADDEERQHLWTAARVELTGYVEDVRPYVQEGACFVVPLRVGGGTRLKILDAWAMGKAVVSTSVGCEGLAAVDGVNIIVRDDPEEFAQAVVSVLKDRALRERLGAAARRTVEERYSWDVIGGGLHRSLNELRRTGRPLSVHGASAR
jgi:glycosyltransferase involved in cell wall biosynthesis